jgi:hypothetical protein
MPENVAAAPSVAGAVTFDLTAINQTVALVFSMPKLALLDEWSFYVFSATAGCNAQVRLETVDITTGIPTGTLVNANAFANVTIASGAGFYSGAFQANFTITAGTIVAYVIKALTAPTALLFGVFNDATASTGLPYTLDSGPTPNSSISPLFGLGVSGGTALQFRNVWPIISAGTITYNVNSSPNAYGNRLDITVSSVISGVRLWFEADGPGLIKLYDADGSTVLRSVTFGVGLPPFLDAYINDFYFNSPIALPPGQYFLSVEPNTATSLTFYNFVFPSAKYRSGSPLGGNSLARASTTVAGGLPLSPSDWFVQLTQQTTIVPIIESIETGGVGQSAYTFVA